MVDWLAERKQGERENMPKITFASSTACLILELPFGLSPLSSGETRQLHSFYRSVQAACRFLIEFAACRFERRSREASWRLDCSLVRNDFLSSSRLTCLAAKVDWVVNSYDELLEHPERSYNSCSPGDALSWLKKVRDFFAQVSLLLTVIARWLGEPPSALPTQEVVFVSRPMHDFLYDDFVNSYFRGAIRFTSIGF